MEAQILERLGGLGVPQDFLDHRQSGLVAYVKDHPIDIEELIAVLFPTDDDAEQALSRVTPGDPTLKELEDVFRESIIWLQWLMFMGDPGAAIEEISQLCGERGVCGVVWKHRDSAYRCNTCAEDPTRAICVACFKNGDHKGHDYYIAPVSAGFCDCGDVMGWKPSGFCTNHKGTVQAIPTKFANSMGPILESFFRFWKHRLEQSLSQQCPPHAREAGEKLTHVAAEVFLEFCGHSECLLSFISEKLFPMHGLMEILVGVEQQFSYVHHVYKLHDLLLKLLCEPKFKCGFAKAFVGYYPTVIALAIKKNSVDSDILGKYPLVKRFSVQILTPQLVKEMEFLPMLLGCLENIFRSCAGDDGRLKTLKWDCLYGTTLHVVDCIKFVMMYSVVPIYATHGWQEITRMWMRILSFVQGMYLQECMHIKNMKHPFVLGYELARVNSYLVGGAFSAVSSEEVENDSGRSVRQELEDPNSKIGRVSQECSVSSLTGRTFIDHTSNKVAETKRDCVSIPSFVSWLTFECLRTIDSWLVLDDSLSRFSSLTSTGEILGRQNSITSRHIIGNLDSRQYPGEEAGGSSSDDFSTQTDCSTHLESLKVLSSSEWPDIVYYVSSLDISMHIPLHRLLSMVLHRSFRECYCESATLNVRAATSGGLSLTSFEDFFPDIFGDCYPYGFSSFLMEHPLRIRVFLAQVRAGFWRRDGEAATVARVSYHSASECEKGLELDLFLLQCCAALAPPDLYVRRILERYGLSTYLNLEQSSENESILVQEMLTLIIQIVKERRFCGLTTAECLERELVYKLSVEDATHSQLLESVPRDLLKIGNFQQILDSIAVYYYPFGLNQGMYKLRPECWKKLDLYHPRFNSRDLQIAEERYLRFCNTSAMTAQVPNWSKIYQPLTGIARIATCKAMLQIVRSVLFYAAFSHESMTFHAPEGVLLTAMHVLSLALNICSQRTSDQNLHIIGEVIPILEFASEEIFSSRHADQSLLSLLVILMRLYEKEKKESLAEAVHSNISSLCANILKRFAELEPKCFIKLQKIAPEVVNQLLECNSNLDDNMTVLASGSQKHKAIARERQAAVMEKMKAQQSKFLKCIESTVGHQEADVSECGEDLADNNVLHDSKVLEKVKCSLCHDTDSESPVCFLIHLQKSRVLSFLDRGPISWEHSSQYKGDHFSPGNSAISTGSEREMQRLRFPGEKSNVSDSSHLGLANLVQSAVNSFAWESQPHEINEFLGFINIHFPTVRNIHCPSISEDVLVKTSSIENLEEHAYSLIQENLRSKFLQKDSKKCRDDFSISGGIQERSCQSILLGKYIASISKEITNIPSGSGSLHSRQNEAQSHHKEVYTYGFGPPDCDGIHVSSCRHAVHLNCLERYTSSLKDRYARGTSFEGSHIINPYKGEFLCPVCRGIVNSVLPTPLVLSSTASSSREGDSLRIQEAAFLMESAAFIAGNKEFLKSIPLQQFTRQKSNPGPLSHALCRMYFPSKSEIFESSRVSHSLLLWDMLKYSIVTTEIAARSGKLISTPTHGYDSLNELKSSSGFILSLLLNIVQGSRAETIPTTLLRFRGIQLFMESLCLGSSNVGLEGNLLCLLEMSDSQALDIQFWRRTSDPVLAHDSFSSLMWALFCLPISFLSCKDSFFCLVHIFYLVTITQAILICWRNGCSLSEWGSDTLITDIRKFTGNQESLLQCLDSKFIDSCHDFKDAIRSVSCTFLQRCLLLWELINSSATFPFSHGNQGTILDHIGEVESLEMIFKIPPIDMVINDGMSRSMAKRWLDHFTNEFKFQGRNVLYCTPSVPFSLVVLPNLYEDLIIKYKRPHCADCRSDLEEPALCLLCGYLCGQLCTLDSVICCRKNECATHAMACGAGIGVFLLLRRTTIVLQRAGWWVPWPSLYLDDFGGEDVNLRRGRPLHLNEERYLILTHMVASHVLHRRFS